MNISIEKFDDSSFGSYQYIFHCSDTSLSFYAAIGLGLLQSIIRSEVCPQLKHIQLELERVIYKSKPFVDPKLIRLIESLIEIISNPDEVRSTRMAWLFSYMNSNKGPADSISSVLQEYMKSKYKRELSMQDTIDIKMFEIICLEFKIYVKVLKSGNNSKLITAGQTGEMPILVLYQQQELFSLLYHEEAAKFDSNDFQLEGLAFNPFSCLDKEKPEQVNIKKNAIPNCRSLGSEINPQKLQIPSIAPNFKKSPVRNVEMKNSELNKGYDTVPREKHSPPKPVGPPLLNLGNTLPGKVDLSSRYSEVKIINSLCATIIDSNNFGKIDCTYLANIVQENHNQNEIEGIKKLLELSSENYRKCQSCLKFMDCSYFSEEIFNCSIECKVCNICRLKVINKCIRCEKTYSVYEIDTLRIFQASMNHSKYN